MTGSPELAAHPDPIATHPDLATHYRPSAKHGKDSFRCADDDHPAFINGFIFKNGSSSLALF